MNTTRASAAAEGAQVLLAAGHFDEARRLFSLALEHDPSHLPASAGLTRLLLAENDVRGALELATSALRYHPTDVRVLTLRGDIGLELCRRGLWEAAVPLLESAASLEPWNAGLASALRRARRPAYLEPEVEDPQLGRTLLRYSAREGDTYIFVIDVVGTCNLRCPTCPVGNSPNRPNGLMSLDLFEQIVAKIRRESPVPHPQVNLYNWGEPLLHPDLPVMIRRLRELGMRSHLSSNLNIRRGLDAVIAAHPDELKISLSGFSRETYARAHARGDLELVKANMHRIRASLDLHHAPTKVWLGHHIYRSNQHEMEPVRQRCAELGFAYHPIAAFYMPLERVVDAIEGRHNPLHGGIIEDLLLSPVDRARAMESRPVARFDCELRFNQTVINHDGTVALCCTVYDAPNMLGVSYLDEDFAALEARKYRHPFCRTCFAHNLQYNPPDLDPPLPGPPLLEPGVTDR